MSTLNNSSLEQRLETLEKAVARIEKMLLSMGAGAPVKANSAWMTEKETSELLDLSVRSLRDLRKDNVLRSSTASGRKIKYFRKDVEAYLEGKKQRPSKKIVTK